jgi:transposase-like protein
MARGKAHSDEVKAQAMAALLTGQGVAEVAKAYKLPERTVRDWLNSPEFAEVRHKKRDRIGELLGDYVETNLVTLKAQSEHFRDKAWLSRQPASELAVLHGVIADKTIRILEAAEIAECGETGAP